MKLSPHFDSTEFRCHCGACGDPLVAPELIVNLEAWRTLLNADTQPGQPEHRIVINSGCRCPAWNKKEGGKTGSLHLYNPHTGLAGKAADCYSPTRSLREVYQAALRIPGFHGIGLAPAVAPDPATGHPGRRGYVHVDVRVTLARVQWGYDDSGKTVALAVVLPRLDLPTGVDA